MARPHKQLTPEELLAKEEKIARDQFTYICNRIKGEWSFGRIKSLHALLSLYGIDDRTISNSYRADELLAPINFEFVKAYLEDRRIELESALFLKRNPPILDSPATQSQFTQEPQTSSVNTQVEVEKFAAEEQVLTEEDKDYGWVPAKKQKAFLFWFQKKAAKQILDAIVQKKHGAALLVAATGSGKTWIYGAVIAKLVEMNYHVGKTFTPWPYVVITKAPVVEQTKRVLEDQFGLTESDVLVINIEQLRSQFGKRFVKEEIIVEDGIERCVYKWRPNIYPIFVGLDECQSVKNDTSEQHKVMSAYNDIESENTFQLFISATPGSKVSEFKCFSVASRVPYTFGIQKDAPLSNGHWQDFANNIASDYGRLDIKPEEHSPGAITRLMNYLDQYIVRVKGIKPQFHARNHIEVLDFVTEAGRKEYMDAWEDFLTEKAKIEGDEALTAGQSRFQILAQLTVFLKAAESNSDRIKILGDRLYHDVTEGFAGVCATRNKITIVKLVQYLKDNFGVSRDEISLIWGGAPTITKKQKLKRNIMSNPALLQRMLEEGIGLEDLDLDEVEDIEEAQLDPSLRLGPQSQKQRQIEIDRFQKGITKYCFYTFRAGGVGLSLHHTDEWTEQKCRRKPSGYVFVEDILSIPIRPRRVYVAPTWSAIELIQGVGRAPRLTSLSDTHQYMLFFKATVEERQARVVGIKMHCMTKVVRNHESWEDLIVGRRGMTDDEVEDSLKQTTTIDDPDKASDDSNGSSGFYNEDDEEDD